MQNNFKSLFMSKNLWSKDVCGNIRCIIFWRNAGILIIVFFMKNSALALLPYLLGAMFLLLQYAPKHVFPLGIDENVSCIFPPQSWPRSFISGVR